MKVVVLTMVDAVEDGVVDLLGEVLAAGLEARDHFIEDDSLERGVQGVPDTTRDGVHCGLRGSSSSVNITVYTLGIGY